MLCVSLVWREARPQRAASVDYERPDTALLSLLKAQLHSWKHESHTHMKLQPGSTGRAVWKHKSLILFNAFTCAVLLNLVGFHKLNHLLITPINVL